jgi:hypothetical protein
VTPSLRERLGLFQFCRAKVDRGRERPFRDRLSKQVLQALTSGAPGGSRCSWLKEVSALLTPGPELAPQATSAGYAPRLGCPPAAHSLTARRGSVTTHLQGGRRKTGRRSRFEVAGHFLQRRATGRALLRLVGQGLERDRHLVEGRPGRAGAVRPASWERAGVASVAAASSRRWKEAGWRLRLLVANWSSRALTRTARAAIWAHNCSTKAITAAGPWS